MNWCGTILPTRKFSPNRSDIQVELADCEEISVRGDRHRLRQLLLNLADNAIKYNQPQGRVTMGLRRANGFAEF